MVHSLKQGYLNNPRLNVPMERIYKMIDKMTPKSDKKFEPLPVHGYVAQSEKNTKVVNQHKVLEEHLLRLMDEYFKLKDDVDQRWLAIARTDLEKGFMALNRSIFKPQRFDLSKVIPNG